MAEKEEGSSWIDPSLLVGLGLVAAGAIYYLASRRERERISVPIDNQSIELPGGVRISRYCVNEELLAYKYEDSRTLYEAFMRGKRVSNDGHCLGWRETKTSPYQWLTYSEVEERFMNFGSGLSKIGVAAGQETFLGVYSSNCIEWTIIEQSCHAYSRIVVALYDTLGPEAVAHIINQAAIECIVCHSSKVSGLISQVSNCPSLKKLITIGSEVSEDEKKAAADVGLELFTFQEVEEQGKEHRAEPVLPTPNDITTICYTSGTTGLPKGVILTHGNVIANVSGMCKHIEESIVLSPSDCHISFLPLAHMMERCVQAIVFMNGLKLGYMFGDIKNLVNDIQVLKPTIFISVPRLLNRIYDKVLSGVNSNKTKKWLFDTAFKSKLSEVKRGILRRDSIWDYIVFGNIQKLLGGNVRLIITGSAPISERVVYFYQVAFGCYIVEGYGQTETSSGCTMSLPADTTCGHVGPPVPSAKVKVVDVPDLNYFASNGEGEICFKGPSCTSGYFKEEEKTKALIDEDGWVHSGDIGKWLPNGTLKITDRVKHIFKLSQGLYIAPEKVENVCSRSPFIAQMFLYGDSLRSSCVAIVVPDEEVLMQWAGEHDKGGKSFEELCTDEEVKKAIFEDLYNVGKRDGLSSLEIPKAIELTSTAFSVENDLLTPTFKLKRPAARTKYMPDIVEMYSQLPA
ncbi:PREDICTED: long-chain-fatty-acid--CoA ligase 1-like [Amphimedon queenslandica]|uniref:Long-chain-fatty-acid--CoA ligase n=1 Tax=Amphimedon queenslandica TaxID=400682 RepID=A0A1X7U4D9_AMPQE|nr:PREDICTED: long-chain-fatty-acid--CoA ligase 1-like [Amphimedon queenslandica]|eukprot:XP_019856159.1 PREDICTED: long-chain-fatty-acid--CoA ligase 1-like [Amphimedon queenslandica]